MARGITKDDPKRWVLVRNNESGENSFVGFGNLGSVGSQGLSSRQPIIQGYMTEDELETEVNLIAGDSNYYQDAVETSSSVFIGESGKYTPNLE
jgi:hypothetical protein